MFLFWERGFVPQEFDCAFGPSARDQEGGIEIFGRGKEAEDVYQDLRGYEGGGGVTLWHRRKEMVCEDCHGHGRHLVGEGPAGMWDADLDLVVVLLLLVIVDLVVG